MFYLFLIFEEIDPRLLILGMKRCSRPLQYILFSIEKMSTNDFSRFCDKINSHFHMFMGYVYLTFELIYED